MHNKRRPFFITYYRLAEALTMSGIEVTPCTNIYNADRPAWKCPLTKEAAEIISTFFTDIGKTVPDFVLDELKK